MGLRFKTDVMQLLKDKGVSRQEIYNNIKSEAYLTKIKKREIVSINAIAALCKLLDMQPGDLIEYIPDPESRSESED